MTEKATKSDILTGGPLVGVKELKFRQGIFVDVPGKHGASAVRTGEPVASGYWRIQFDPRLRHHRIDYFAPSGGAREAQTLYVPESWCTWMPE